MNTQSKVKTKYLQAITVSQSIDENTNDNNEGNCNTSIVKDDTSVFLTETRRIRSRSLQFQQTFLKQSQILADKSIESQVSILLRKRKELNDVEDLFEMKKKEHVIEMKRLQDIENELNIKFENLRIQKSKFQVFINENDEKYQRYETKEKVERKLLEDKINEANDLQFHIYELEEHMKLIINQVKRHEKYKLYLEKVLEDESISYDDINGILNRYNTLAISNRDLLIQTQAKETLIDQITKEFREYTLMSQNRILSNTSIVEDQQKRLEKLRIQLKLEQEYNEKDYLRNKEVSMLVSQVDASIRNLYHRCITTMKNNLFHRDSNIHLASGNRKQDAMTILLNQLNDQLNIIRNRISDLMEISNEYNPETWAIEKSQVDKSHVVSNNTSVSIENNSTGGVGSRKHSIATTIISSQS